ncbi:MAG: FecR family protein, partial [Candidatus Neomarinimicrobiota bacterium]|nr:FecR family protein [Candidatus Neomarinimicrobiota bacterium]
MTRSLSVIITLLLFLPQLQADVIARLIKVEGNVYFKRMGMDTFSEKAKPGAAILNGDAIKVGETGFGAIIYLDDRTILKIRENTKFSFMETQNTRTVDLTHGTLLNNVKSEGRTKSFRIQTPVSVASVKGTQFAAIVSQTGLDQFIGKEGLFEVLNMISGETVSVGPGQKAISNATGNLVQAPASPEDYPNDPEVEEYQEPEIEDVDESPDETRQEKSPDVPEIPEELKNVE